MTRWCGWILLAIASTCVRAEDLVFDLPVEPAAQQRVAIAADALAHASALRVSWTRDDVPPAHARADAYLDVCLVTADERFFALAEPLPLDQASDQARIPLDAAHWSGGDGSFGADAISALSHLRVRVHTGVTRGRVRGGLAIDDAPGRCAFTVALADGGLIDRGPWRELRVRLLGGIDGERGTLDLVDGARRWPLFLDQPAAVTAGEWRAHGPALWTLRLRPEEHPTGVLQWSDGGRAWESSPLPALAVVASRPLPPPPRQAFAVPVSPSWSGRPTATDGAGARALLPRTELPSCPAPILMWLSEWSGFRGPTRVAFPQAMACDAVFAAGVSDIDLLPQLLFEEHGAFRFGLSPWLASRSGPWRCPQDAFASDAPWRGWPSHAREVVARARAAPGLARWRLGLVQSANTPAEESRLRAVLDATSALVARCDGRPVVACHPQAVDYGYRDEQSSGQPCWFGFEESLQGWQSGPAPLVADGAARIAAFASDGAGSLRVAIGASAASAGEEIGGATCAIDGNLFSVETLACDLAADGGGEVQFYAWATDEHHRWFQQRLACIPANHRWNTVTIAFGDDAPWQALVTGAAWGPDARRRIRRIGIMAFAHRAGGATAESAFYLDRVRRLGWPREASPDLAFAAQTAPASEVARYQPLSADFELTIAARNPFDPDSADVFAEVEGPSGGSAPMRLRYPAYWAEPIELAWADGRERAIPAGNGSWHWRFCPPRDGRWRWRLCARVKYRDAWREVQEDWRETLVRPAAADDLVPVRVSRTDPQSWEREDGAWFYPLGINLRSPGDARQDQVMSELGQTTPGAADDIQRPLRRSADFERLGTRAYERWFARLHAAGGNWARVWMCPWWCGLEWTRAWDGYGGMTWYSQESAARLDRVLDLAALNRVYVQIELQNHGMFGEKVDAEWPDNPYNAKNGGPCRTPIEFFARDDVWAIHAKRLRYTLARWGWRSHLAAWVLSSEMEFTAPWYSESPAAGDDSPTLERWVRRSLDWFRDNDPQQRAVSIHFSHPWEGAKLWKMPGLGFSNSNAYTGFQTFPQLGGQRDGQFDLPRALDWYLAKHFPPAQLHRPTLIGEWGGHWAENHSPRLAAELHTGVWLQAVLPYAGDTGFWWYLWIDASDSWHEFAPIAAFVAGEDRRGAGFVASAPRCDRQPIVSATGMASATEHRYYVWTTGLDQDPSRTHPGDAGGVHIATGQPGSRWRIERWRCSDGAVVDRGEDAADAQGQIVIALGPLEPDAAFKLHRIDAADASPPAPAPATPSR